MPQIGPLEIAVVLLIALLVFGPNRLPEIARQVGGALRELRKIQHNLRDDLREMMGTEPEGGSPPPTLPPKDDPAAGEVFDVAAAEVAAPPDTDMAPPPPPPEPD